MKKFSERPKKSKQLETKKNGEKTLENQKEANKKTNGIEKKRNAKT